MSTQSFAKSKMVYSTVSLNNCATIQDSEEYDSFKKECPSFGDYKIYIEGGDARYDLKLSYKGKTISTPELESFHGPGSRVIEWRYTNNNETGEISYDSLMFRIEHATGEDYVNDSILYAVRLNGGDSCVVGAFKESEHSKGSENVLARKILDDKSSECID
jgi:hypothetical protein